MNQTWKAVRDWFRQMLNLHSPSQELLGTCWCQRGQPTLADALQEVADSMEQENTRLAERGRQTSTHLKGEGSPMADARYTLAEARAIIDAEKCVRKDKDIWCLRHRYHWRHGSPECGAAPEVADVAAQLLATVERVEKLADEWATAVKRYQWCGDCGAPEQERFELLAAINGEGRDGMSWQSDTMITKDGTHIAFGDWDRDDKTLRIDLGQASLVIQLTDDDLRKLIIMLGGRL